MFVPCALANQFFLGSAHQQVGSLVHVSLGNAAPQAENASGAGTHLSHAAWLGGGEGLNISDMEGEMGPSRT